MACNVCRGLSQGQTKYMSGVLSSHVGCLDAAGTPPDEGRCFSIQRLSVLEEIAVEVVKCRGSSISVQECDRKRGVGLRDTYIHRGWSVGKVSGLERNCESKTARKKRKSELDVFGVPRHVHVAFA